MNDYLVFDTHTAADIALETIYSNMVAAIDSTDLLNVITQDVVLKDDLTKDDMVKVNSTTRNYPIFGVNALTKVKNPDTGYTTAWAVAQETISGKWVFPKPEVALMAGVVGYTVEPYNQDWFNAAL